MLDFLCMLLLTITTPPDTVPLLALPEGALEAFNRAAVGTVVMIHVPCGGHCEVIYRKVSETEVEYVGHRDCPRTDCFVRRGRFK